MKERKKRKAFPKSLMRNLSEDIKILMETGEGRLLALEILEEIPYDLRPYVLEGLSSFYEQEIAEFFYLVKEEYGKELEAVCNRGLEKFRMAGMRIKVPRWQTGRFYKAFVSRTRHTGQVTLDVAYQNRHGFLDVECFFLSYGLEGLHSFLVISEIPAKEYQRDRSSLPDMVEVGWEEAAYLVKKAYECNVKNMTRPALGKFLYLKYLESSASLSYEQELELIRRIIPALGPRELVNSFFYAQRNQDIAYMAAILDQEKWGGVMFFTNLRSLMMPEAVLIEGRATEVIKNKRGASVKAYAIHIKEDELYRTDFTFLTTFGGGQWRITDVCCGETVLFDEGRGRNPFSDPIRCLVYDILDLDELFQILENIDGLYEVGELPFGVHLRVKEQAGALEGVFFLTGVLADIVVNADELVVMSRYEESLRDIERLLASNPKAVKFSEAYDTEIATAYGYLSGQFLSFADLITCQEDDLLFDDGMRFLTARYLIKDRPRVMERLDQLMTKKYRIAGDYQVYYEFRDVKKEGFVAEYILGDNWVTVSAFGEKDFELARERFEKGIRECLEFAGMEVKCEGIFEILTGEVKRQYPELEKEIKEVYLEKWYRSKLKALRGMSPQDACKTTEGKILLWRMFKDMKRKERMRQELGMRTVVDLKEYIKKVDMKKEPKPDMTS